MDERGNRTIEELTALANEQKALADGIAAHSQLISDGVMKVAQPIIAGVQANRASIDEGVARIAGPIQAGIKSSRKRIMKGVQRVANPIADQIGKARTLLTGGAARAQGGSFRPVQSTAPVLPGNSRAGQVGARQPGQPARPGTAPGLSARVGLPGVPSTNPPGGTLPAPAAGGNCPPCTAYLGLVDSQQRPYTGSSQSLPPGTPCPSGWRAAGNDCDGNTVCTPLGTDAHTYFGPSPDPNCAQSTLPANNGAGWYCVIDPAACGGDVVPGPLGSTDPGYQYYGPYPDLATASQACKVLQGQCLAGALPLPPAPGAGGTITPSAPPLPPAPMPAPPVAAPPVPVQPPAQPPPGSDICACLVYAALLLSWTIRVTFAPPPPAVADDRFEWLPPPVLQPDYEDTAAEDYQPDDTPTAIPPFIVQEGGAVGGSTVGIHVPGD